MLIRSQDKNDLINLYNIQCITIHPAVQHEEMVGIYITDFLTLHHSPAYMIGEYSTQTKALKVLDMIQHQYASVTCVGSVAAVGRVFQMPQDDEVDA